MFFSKKVAVIQRIFPHYRRAIFSALAATYNFKLFHGVDNGNIPQSTDGFSVISKNHVFSKFTYQSNVFSLLKFRPEVIVQEFSISFLNLYINYIISKLIGARYIVWGHGYDRSNNFDPSKSFSDQLRLFFLKRADACILYSDDVKDELSQFAPNCRFTVARNSIASPEKESIYSNLSIKERFHDSVLNLCFVARLSENKKVELLSRLAVILKRNNISFLFNIVGDGECKDSLISQCASDGVLENFNFLGAIYDEARVAEIIFNSDFMVIPAWCGLSINHSFCYATPLATLSTQQHPPEIQFARDGYNAVLSGSIEELAERLVSIKSEPALLESMRKNSRFFYEQHLSISAMLQGFTDAISDSK